VSLNEQSNDKPYVLGRLFSVLERLQIQAHGKKKDKIVKDESAEDSISDSSELPERKLNRTIRDRYFASACTNPRSVFPTLLKLSMHHARKLRTENRIGSAVYFEKLKTDLIGRLPEEVPFPSSLTLEDQGRFILGYYHQTQDFFTSNKDKKNDKEEVKNG
jgi:CRISPR-associated protein Csd1